MVADFRDSCLSGNVSTKKSTFKRSAPGLRGEDAQASDLGFQRWQHLWTLNGAARVRTRLALVAPLPVCAIVAPSRISPLYHAYSKCPRQQHTQWRSQAMTCTAHMEPAHCTICNIGTLQRYCPPPVARDIQGNGRLQHSNICW